MRLLSVVLVLVSTAPPAAAPSPVDWQALATQYTQALARSPADVSTRFSLAMVYAHEGQLRQGWRELRTLDKDVGDKRKEFTRQIVAASQVALKRDPADILTRYRLAFALYFQGRKDATRREFERIVTLEPHHSWSLGYLGYTYADAGDLDRAIAVWERGVTADPSNAVLHYVLGMAYTRKGQLRKAAAAFAAAYRDRTLRDYVNQQEGK